MAAVGLERAGQAIKDAGLKLSGYCRGGLFPATGEHVAAARDDNRRMIDEAVVLGAPCIILVAGGLPQFARPGSTPSKDIVGARRMIEDGITELMAYARQANMPLALEPLHPMYAADRACGEHAGSGAGHRRPARCRAAPARRASPSTSITPGGIPISTASIARAGRAKRLIAYHVCDWLVPTKRHAQRPRHDGGRHHRVEDDP